jgi:hypothetical protein
VPVSLRPALAATPPHRTGGVGRGGRLRPRPPPRPSPSRPPPCRYRCGTNKARQGRCATPWTSSRSAPGRAPHLRRVPPRTRGADRDPRPAHQQPGGSHRLTPPTHRPLGAWSGFRAWEILRNPKYTGYRSGTGGPEKMSTAATGPTHQRHGPSWSKPSPTTRHHLATSRMSWTSRRRQLTSWRRRLIGSRCSGNACGSCPSESCGGCSTA